jgi:hypothetical protein
MVALEPMSEFKFACPVCGQHITADSSTSGGHLKCPTCFQQIIVPQAPASGDSKFILSATQVGKPRPTGPDLTAPPEARPRTANSWLVLTAMFVIVAATGATVFVFRDRIFKHSGQGSSGGKPVAKAPPRVVLPIPTNIVWTMELTNADYPTAAAAGKVHGEGFLCERATLTGGILSLRQGNNWPPDLGVSVLLFARAGEELSGKSIQIAPDRGPPLPRVVMRWKNDSDKAETRNVNSGYALRVDFGQATNGRMPGQIYLCLPDESKSVVAGTFDAEIRKPPPPKPGSPATPAQAPQPKPPATPKPPKPAYGNGVP